MTYTMYNTHAHWSMVIQHLCSLPSQSVLPNLCFCNCAFPLMLIATLLLTISQYDFIIYAVSNLTAMGSGWGRGWIGELQTGKIWNSIQNSTQGELGSLWWVWKFINSKAFCGSLAPVEFNHRLNFYFFVDRCSSTQSLILSCKTLRNQIKNVILIVKCLHERVGSYCT